MWSKAMHPAHERLSWLSKVDFALFWHGFEQHGRDYRWHIQDCLGTSPGEHEILFTHCVQVGYQTRVSDQVWSRSWDDVLLDYEKWEAAGQPEGYLWGSNWSLAYPGLAVVEDSEIAAAWTKRIGKPFYEITLETDRLFLRLIFHDIRHRKLSDSTQTVSSVLIPLPPGSKST
jgi:hypothetical protein